MSLEMKIVGSGGLLGALIGFNSGLHKYRFALQSYSLQPETYVPKPSIWEYLLKGGLPGLVIGVIVTVVALRFMKQRS